MKILEMVMPSMGESIMECTVLHLLKKEGEAVVVDDSVLEVATDKVDTEVPCPYVGKLVKWLVKENDVVPIGSPVAQIEVTDDTPGEPAFLQQAPAEEVAVATQLEQEFEQAITQKERVVSSQETGMNPFYSPLVLSI
ncbi:biotin/lipoyl-containing protein, partial [Dyadobacter sp.]|uniref:biotin/lipoyl-containing protein n=1 Tax=Dyadobacter sp. TaxID=1914288 RepID=UPI003F728297